MIEAREWNYMDSARLRDIPCINVADRFLCDRAVEHITNLQAKLARAHHWVLDNQVHSESYNQFVKALEQDKEGS